MKLKLKQIGPRKMEVVSDDWSFVVDLKEQFGGENSGPNPSELAVAATAACEVLTGVVWAAGRHGVELRNIDAEVEWECTEKPERISRIGVSIGNVGSQLDDPKKLRAFTGIAKGCTIGNTFKTPPEMTLTVE
jgi:uncharacterized OsmC-like protein